MRHALLVLALVGLGLPGASLAAPADMGASLAPLPADAWTLDAAAHLLRRAGFGGTLEEVKALHALGLDGAVDHLLDWDGPDPDVPGLALAVTSRPGRAEMMAATTREERQKITRQYRREDRYQYAVIREWWLQTMIRTAYPLRERLVLFWHGHFTSSYRDVRDSYHMYMQNTLFRRYAAGNFRALLHGISKDPAMLEYLDNNRNRKAQPNENYAREVMELFTLGVGNYTEKDVKEAARALTGWTFLGNSFYFDRNQHDDGEKTILGHTGRFDGDQFLDILLEQPVAARHIAGRIYRYFAHDFADDAVIDGLARTLRENDWELKPMLRQLFRSRAFYAPYAVGTKIKSPAELVVSLFRQLDMRARVNPGLTYLCDSLGQTLLEPPNVKGWPGGREWITTSHLLARYNIAGALVGLPQDKVRTVKEAARETRRYMGLVLRMQRFNPNGYEDMDAAMGGGGDGMGMGGDSMAPNRSNDRRRRGRRGRVEVPTYDVVGKVRAAGLEGSAAIVDYFCRTLLAHPPSDEMRATLIAYLDKDGPFRLDEPDARAQLHGLLRLIVSTPEFQLI